MSKNTIQEIQAILNGASSPDELIDEVAGEYFEVCAEANRRCSESAGLLADGFRDEALALADREPKITQLVAQLDFPQRDEWLDMLLMRGFETPPHLMLETVSAIEEAYELQRQLEPLMQKHRLLALSRAPLPARISVLRKLKSADRTNPIWGADIEWLEQARLAQIRDAARVAQKKCDLAQLDKLAEELNGKWTVSVPKDLFSEVTVARDELAREQAIAEMKQLVPALNDCLAAFDTDRAQPLRQHWNDANATAQMTDGHPVFDQAKEALLWLDEFDRERATDDTYQNALADLEQAIEDELELPELERRWYAIEKFNRDVPPELERRYRLLHDRVADVQRRRATMKISSLVAGVVFVAALIGWYLYQQTRQHRLSDARSQIKMFVEPLNYTGAMRFHESLATSLQNDVEIIQSLESIKSKHNAETTRIAEFDQTLNTIQLDGPLDDSVETALRRAESLAVTTAEKEKVELAKAKVESERTRRQKERGDGFQQELDSIIGELSKVERMEMGDAAKTALKNLRHRLQDLQDRHSGSEDGKTRIAPAILGQVNKLVARIDEREKAIDNHLKSLSSLADVTGDVGDAKSFSNRLIEFSNKYPASIWAADFRQSAAEQKFWESFQNWRKLASDPAWVSMNRADKDTITRLKTELDARENEMPLSVLAARLPVLRANLDKVLNVKQADRNELIKGLDRNYGADSYRNQKLIITNDGKWRYLSKDYKQTGNSGSQSVTFWYYENLTKDKDVFLRLDDSEIDQKGRAGQCEVAAAMLRVLNEPQQLDLDNFAWQLIQAALMTPAGEGVTRADPIVQGLMVVETLLFASQTSVALQDFSSKWLRKIAPLKLDEIDWMDGNKQIEDVARVRKEMEWMLPQILQDSQTLAGKIQRYQDSIASIFNWQELIEFEWVGWMCAQDNARSIMSSSQLENGIELYVLTSANGTKPADFNLAGKYENGVIADLTAETFFRSGRPVFVRSSSAVQPGKNP